MKICFVMSTPFTLGGEQRVVSCVASLLYEQGNEITILCTDNKTPINYKMYNLNENVKIDFIKEKNIFSKFIRKFASVLNRINKKTGIFKNNVFILQRIVCDNYTRKKIKNKLEKENYDVIIGVAGYFSLLISTIECNKSIKKIGWQHNSFEAYFRNKQKYHWNQEALFKKLVPKLDAYVVLTNYDRNRIKEEWDIECTTIYNPKSFNSEKVSKLEEKTFLAIGRYVYAKGFDNLIKAFKVFSETNEEWNLKIVGDGEEKEHLIDLIKNYSLESRVELCHTTNNVQKYFLQCSAFVLPSRWEGMPMVMLEALEMGVPIIAYDIPVVKEIIKNGQEGVIVEKENIEKYANALKEYVKDDEKIKKMGEDAKIASMQFTHENIYKEWEKLINTKNGVKIINEK